MNESPAQKTKNTAKRIKCKTENPSTRWWKSTGECEDKNLIALVDYTNGDKNLYFKNGTKATLTEVPGVNYGGKYTLNETQKNKIEGKTISFSFPNGKVSHTADQYLFYAKVGTINYSRYLNSELNESSPPSNAYNNSFPNTSAFQLGYGTIAQALQSPMRIEFR